MLRASLPKETLKFIGVFEVALSHAVRGGWNLVLATAYYKTAAKRRASLTEVARASICQKTPTCRASAKSSLMQLPI